MNLISNRLNNKQRVLKTSSNFEYEMIFISDVVEGNVINVVDSDLKGLKKVKNLNAKNIK